MRYGDVRIIKLDAPTLLQECTLFTLYIKGVGGCTLKGYSYKEISTQPPLREHACLGVLSLCYLENIFIRFSDYLPTTRSISEELNTLYQPPFFVK